MSGFSKWKISDNGTLIGVQIDNEFIPLTQGVEFSDGTVHFKQSPEQKNTARTIIRKHVVQKNNAETVMDVFLSKTPCTLTINQTFSSQTILRTVELVIHEGGFFEDVALRNIFPSHTVDHVEIAGKKIPFDGWNRNHQFETNQVKLFSPKWEIDISYSAKHPSCVGLTAYARSMPNGAWAIHGRLFPKNTDQAILRMCRPEWDKEIPFTRWLTRIKPLREYLWHVGERPERKERKTFGLVVLGVAYFPPGTRIVFTETIVYQKKESA